MVGEAERSSKEKQDEALGGLLLLFILSFLYSITVFSGALDAVGKEGFAQAVLVQNALALSAPFMTLLAWYLFLWTIMHLGKRSDLTAPGLLSQFLFWTFIILVLGSIALYVDHRVKGYPLPPGTGRDFVLSIAGAVLSFGLMAATTPGRGRGHAIRRAGEPWARSSAFDSTDPDERHKGVDEVYLRSAKEANDRLERERAAAAAEPLGAAEPGPASSERAPEPSFIGQRPAGSAPGRSIVPPAHARRNEGAKRVAPTRAEGIEAAAPPAAGEARPPRKRRKEREVAAEAEAAPRPPSPPPPDAPRCPLCRAPNPRRSPYCSLCGARTGEGERTDAPEAPVLGLGGGP